MPQNLSPPQSRMRALLNPEICSLRVVSSALRCLEKAGQCARGPAGRGRVHCISLATEPIGYRYPSQQLRVIAVSRFE